MFSRKLNFPVNKTVVVYHIPTWSKLSQAITSRDRSRGVRLYSCFVVKLTDVLKAVVIITCCNTKHSISHNLLRLTKEIKR